MSKKHQRNKQRKSSLWLLLLLGGALLAIAAFLFARQGAEDGSGTPSLAVDQKLIEYGDVKFGVEKTFAIRVTNTGDGTLKFKEKPYIQVLEGC